MRLDKVICRLGKRMTSECLAQGLLVFS
ncbi:uncharacterized protein METZ01_LOCUS285702 [marine metagenome]|uniref:Uncharacterized protein n=1 Tax=marine metagenome TaxID=408172 RepID=A0A382L7D3_9ZZZZ